MDHLNNGYYWPIALILRTKDSATIFNTLHQLEAAGDSTNKYFAARTKLLMAYEVYHETKTKYQSEVEKLLKEALYLAYEQRDVYLEYLVSRTLTEIEYSYKKIEPAVLYGLISLDIDDKYHVDTSSYYLRFVMGEVLYHAREYKESLGCSLKSIKFCAAHDEQEKLQMMSWNTAGLSWQKMGYFDSAINAYKKSIQLAWHQDNIVWVGVVSGNMGQVYYLQHDYDTAEQLLQFDYATNKHYGEFDDAANSLQWVARINLLKGKKDSALIQVKEAMQMLKQRPQPEYFQNLYYATADVYRAFGNTDSFYHYFRLYTSVHDSIERAVAVSSIRIAQMKMDNQQDIFTIDNLQAAKEREKLYRNFIIAVICMLAAIIILFLNRQRLKSNYKQKIVLQEKERAEEEVASARAQLQTFTQGIIEKSALIEKLEQQLHHVQSNAAQQQLLSEVMQQTILTEDDWKKFKLLFEKIYPSFFTNLTQQVHDITPAEQRLTALIWLHLSTKEMAAMLGISPDSVHKTRQRLKHRLRIDAKSDLDEFISTI